MPVSTRSHIKINPDQNEPNQDRRRRLSVDQEDTNMPLHQLRNPHHGLKEKMKALTQLYEQQKKAAAGGGGGGLKNPSPKPEEKQFSTHPSVDLLGSCRKEEEEKENNMMRENNAMPNSTVTRTYVLPRPQVEDAKENVVMGPVGVGGGDKIVGFSCPRRASVTTTTVARKLSMGGVEERGKARGTMNVQEVETFPEKLGKIGSRILVFVRLRPMAKKEKDAGSRCCVRIVNHKDVYLTEFANENDYLRLNRLRGRHFTFDASFPDPSAQHEVYSTT